MTTLTITFNQAANAGACSASVRRMAEHLGGIEAYGRDTPIPLTVVLDVLGIGDALWAVGALGERRTCVAFACDCAERVLPLVTDGERRQHEAIRVTRLWLAGLASDREVRRAARAAAAARAADAAYAAAARAADAAYAAAARAARAADAAADAYAADAYAADAYAAAYAAARAADAAYAAAYDREQECEWQATRLRQYLTREVTA